MKIPFERIYLDETTTIRPAELPGYDTDVEFHKYREMVDDYNNLFTEFGMPQNIFEIGTAQGGSMLLWHWLGINAVGIDVDINRFKPKDYAKKHGIKYFKCNIYEQEITRNLAGNQSSNGYDWIIDDGDHTITGIPAAFSVLWDFVRPGGLYIIEDWIALHHTHRMVLMSDLIQLLVENSACRETAPDAPAEIRLLKTMIILRKKK